MVSVFELWLPVLLAAVAVFVVSSVVHMALNYHKSDYRKAPDEDGVRADIRGRNLPPGEYMFPCADSMKEMGTPEYQAKMNEGPVGYMVLLPTGPWPMGRSLTQWFVFSILVSLVVGYLATIGLGKGAEGGDVFRSTSTSAFLAYGMSSITGSIWKGVSWVTTAKFLLDGLLYGLATGAVFLWLWPAMA